MIRKINGEVPYVSLVILVLGLSIAGCGGDLAPFEGPGGNEALLIINGSPNFPQQLLDTTSERSFSVTNIGRQEATEMAVDFLLSISFSFSGGVYPGSGGTCGETLEPGGSCTLVIQFKPKFTGPTQTALLLNYFDGKQPRTIKDYVLSGTGI